MEKIARELGQERGPGSLAIFFHPTISEPGTLANLLRETCHLKASPQERTCEEGFKSISSDLTSILLPYLLCCFKVFFCYVLPVPTESIVNWSNLRC